MKVHHMKYLYKYMDKSAVHCIYFCLQHLFTLNRCKKVPNIVSTNIYYVTVYNIYTHLLLELLSIFMICVYDNWDFCIWNR